MTTDLLMLAYSAMLLLAMPAVYVTGELVAPGGIPWGFGNRDKDIAFPAWVGRCKRAHANLTENLLPFAALVLIAHVTGKANETTALAATVFFWARVAHFVTYAAGVLYVRTAAYFAALVAMVMIFLELF